MATELSETIVSIEPAADDTGGAALEARAAHLGRESAASAVAVVAPPHPLMGGSLDNPVVESLVRGLASAGAATLRFNWRGVGRSEGVASGDAADAVDDYRAAVRWALAAAGADSRPLIAAGYSFGAVAAVKVAATDRRVSALSLVAPPLAMVALPELGALSVPTHVVVGEHDEFAPVDLLERALGDVAGARLDVVPGADHFFSGADPSSLSVLVATAAGSRDD